MQRERKCYLGIDVSKLWFDVSFISVIDHQKQAMITDRFENTMAGLALMGI